jgi:hypothetical protein
MRDQHDLRGTEAVCERCESAPDYMLTDCPGTSLTAYQKCRVARGRLDYRDGEWHQEITRPRFIGDFAEVTSFLEAELAIKAPG